MALPVDIPAVLKAVTDTREEAHAPIALAVHVDETADPALVAHVRGLFAAPQGANARVAISYMGDGSGAVSRPDDDMAVIVAGNDEGIGRLAADIRAAGVPVMVVTADPDVVGDGAKAQGFPIPNGDMVSVPSAVPALSDGEGSLSDRSDSSTDDGPIDGALDERMGGWVIAACPDKRLAFAHAFGFVRRPLAKEAISATALQNAGVGLLPIIPGADMPIMTLNQAKMLMQIAAAYDQPLDQERLPELAALIGNAFLCRAVARGLVKAVPIAGPIISGGIGFAATQAVGHAAIEYFEAGGSAAGVASMARSAAGEAAAMAQRASETKIGRTAIDVVKKGTAGAVRLVRGAAHR